MILDSYHIGLDCTGQCCTQTWTLSHLLKVNIQRQTWECGGRIPVPETQHLRLTGAAGVPTLRCQKSYPGTDININIVILSSLPARPSVFLPWAGLPALPQV